MGDLVSLGLSFFPGDLGGGSAGEGEDGFGIVDFGGAGGAVLFEEGFVVEDEVFLFVVELEEEFVFGGVRFDGVYVFGWDEAEDVVDKGYGL